MFARSNLLAVTLLTLLCAQVALGWWCTGHMTVAQIAQNNLDSSVKSKVDTIVSKFAAMGPWPMSPDFVQLACWADDVKSNDYSMANWHFLNLPYDPSGVPITLQIQEENVERAVPQMEDAMQKWKYPNDWEMTFALANLIHFMGDIHQPLHVTDFFSAEFPGGDYGGNLFHIVVNGTTQPLHHVWDAICWQYTSEVTRPLTSEGYQLIQNLATQFTSMHNINDTEKAIYNSTIYAQEGFQDAVTYSYANLVPGDTLSTTYLNNCFNVATRRIALAGYRLAAQLNYILKDDSVSSKVQAKMIHKHIKDAHASVARSSNQKRREINARAAAAKLKKL